MSAKPNVEKAEVDKFSAIASRWWDPQGPQAPLHVLNPVRLAYVKRFSALPGSCVLDVGCGGGLLSEAMAREGALVTGLDMSAELINVAKLHMLETRQTQTDVNAQYVLGTVEDYAQKHAGSFDLITCMEMLEHVPDPASIIRACSDLLKPNGKIILSTINRTPQAFALAIVGAEYIAGMLPKGTHHYRKFIRPSEMRRWLEQAGIECDDVSGLQYRPMTKSASLGGSVSVNYLMAGSKAS